MRNKFHPWGIKIFLLCGANGIAYDFCNIPREKHRDKSSDL